mgnify:CR=1 FL=1
MPLCILFPEVHQTYQTVPQHRANCSRFQPKDSTFDIRYSIFDIRYWTFDIGYSIFDIGPSTFDIRHWTFDIRIANDKWAPPFWNHRLQTANSYKAPMTNLQFPRMESTTRQIFQFCGQNRSFIALTNTPQPARMPPLTGPIAQEMQVGWVSQSAAQGQFSRRPLHY